MQTPYKAPLSKYDFRGVLQFITSENRVALEIVPQSRDITYEKWLHNEMVPLLLDLLNGAKCIKFDVKSGEYSIHNQETIAVQIDSAPSPSQPVQIDTVPERTEKIDLPEKKKRGRPRKILVK